jgi:membrane protease YdiL (CAAX protease family)
VTDSPDERPDPPPPPDDIPTAEPVFEPIPQPDLAWPPRPNAEPIAPPPDDFSFVARAPRRRKKPGPAFGGALGWSAALLGAQVVLVVVIVLGFGFLWGDDKLIASMVVATLATLLVAVVVVGARYGRDAGAFLAFRLPAARHAGMVLLLNVPLVLAVLALATWILAFYRALGIAADGARVGEFDELSRALHGLSTWAAIVGVAVFGGLVPAVGEELFFRGFIGRGLVARYGRVAGVVLTSLMFGFVHLHPVQSVTAAVLGVVLHAVYLWTRSLLAPILLHAVHNWLAFGMSAATRGLPVGEPAAEFLPLGLTAASFAAACAVLFLMYRSRVRWVKPNGGEWWPGYPTAESPPPRTHATPPPRSAGAGPVVAAAAALAVFAAVLVRELLR